MIFKTVALKTQSFAQRIFRQQIEENAIISVNNLLSFKRVQDISRKDISVIDAYYGTRVLSDFKLNLEEFYAAYLNHCLKDRRLDLQELAELRHLKQLFGLSDQEVDHLHQRIGGVVYQKTFEEAVADGNLTHEEKAFLHELEDTLRLPRTFSEKIAYEVSSGFLREKLALVTDDHRLSPQEEKELRAVSVSLGISLPAQPASGKHLQRMKLYWALENLDLPIASSAVPLQKGEICHCKSESVQWKKVSGRNWSPPHATQRLFDGSEVPLTTAYGGRHLETVDNGSVYITNKRIIFDGMGNKTSVKLEKVLRLKAYVDAVEIVRESGKNPVFHCKEPGELGVLLERLVRENRL